MAPRRHPYDQVGGGFHRYATDAQAGWCPHFEKMLYDNAQLDAHVLLDAYGKIDTRTESHAAESLARPSETTS